KAVGGASNSAHLYGCAADFTIPDFGDVQDICHALEAHLRELCIDQLIDESGTGARWVHVGRAIPPSTAPRCQCLTIANGATTTGLGGGSGGRGRCVMLSPPAARPKSVIRTCLIRAGPSDSSQRRSSA